MNKIFDFNEKNTPCGLLGRPRELGWPCEMFRITLPKVMQDSKRQLNVFEWCILKLLAYGRYEPKQLAEETCLPPDLIEIILLRLYDCGKIDEYYQVLPDTLNTIERLETEKESEPAEYETCVIFREQIGGALLPMFKEAKLKAEEVNENGSIEKEGKSVRLWHLAPSSNSTSAPTAADVFSALRTMSRRRKVSGESYVIPSAKFVSIAPGLESCELRVRMVLQQNSDWRILNPFGKGWSLELESAYQKLLEQNEQEATKFQEWQTYNTNQRPALDREDDTSKPAYDTPENRSHYPELLKALKRGDVYAALEWTLFYALQKVGTKKIVQLLQIDTRENNRKRLAAAIRFLTASDDSADTNSEESGVENRIFVPLPVKLQSYQNDETAEMQVVLPLAILVSQDDAHFPIRKVFEAYPDCLSRIVNLKERRDSQRHGNSKWLEICSDDDRVFMRNVVTAFLPSIHFTDSPSPVRSEGDARADMRLEARLALQNIFGISAFDRMDSILQENLLQAEMFQQRHNDKAEEDVLPCINNLYAAAQCAFRPLLVGERPESVSVETAAKKAKDVGWGEFPLSLRTVRPEMIQRTLEGADQTLGASVLVWLLVTDSNLLRQIAVKLPSFLLNIHELLTFRKHGNQSCMMQRAKLSELCQTIYTIIRTITEA